MFKKYVVKHEVELAIVKVTNVRSEVTSPEFNYYMML